MRPPLMTTRPPTLVATLAASTVLVKVVSPALFTANAPMALPAPVAPTAPVNVTAPVPLVTVRASAWGVLFFKAPANVTALLVVSSEVLRKLLSSNTSSP